MRTFPDTQLHRNDFCANAPQCVHLIYLLDVAVVDDEFCTGGFEGWFHATRSDEALTFRDKKGEDRFKACVARFRNIVVTRAAPGVTHISQPSGAIRSKINPSSNFPGAE